ncbi:MAG: hypothetical protein JWL85_861 [Candidatus Saccharibacteria bacterium]|nr:hypothetical protein [Candidatus Saccharibacteria bacterium]
MIYRVTGPAIDELQQRLELEGYNTTDGRAFRGFEGAA